METHSPAIKEITPLSERDCFYIVDRYKTAFSYPLHKHEDYELNFIANAAGVKRIVGDSVEIINEYDLVLIANKDLEHVWEQHECKSANIREITIQFSPDLFFDSFLNKNQFASIRKMLEKAQRGLNFPMDAIMKVYPLMDKLAKEQAGFYAVMDFLSVLYELSILVDEAKPLAESSFATINISAESRRVHKVQEYINKNYQENIRLEQLAELIGMTPTAFCRFFKLRTGKTPTDYIIDIRLGHAARFLINTKMSITEICYACGFKNVSNFNRLFRKKKGCSPREFCEHYRKTKIII